MKFDDPECQKKNTMRQRPNPRMRNSHTQRLKTTNGTCQNAVNVTRWSTDGRGVEVRGGGSRKG